MSLLPCSEYRVSALSLPCMGMKRAKFHLAKCHVMGASPALRLNAQDVPPLTSSFLVEVVDLIRCKISFLERLRFLAEWVAPIGGKFDPCSCAVRLLAPDRWDFLWYYFARKNAKIDVPPD